MASSNANNIKENNKYQEVAFITDIEQIRIAIICKRLKGSVSSVDVINWLHNFKSHEKNKARITFFPHRDNFRYKIKNIYSDTILIFIDDFSGSGNQFTTYYNSYIKPLIKQCSYISSLFFLTLFYLQRAKSFIENTNIEISVVGELRYPVFLTNRSVFGNRSNMLPIREFCHFYGKNLFSTTDNETHVVRDHPLGYDNSQALIIFAYNPPNNTLPIIWSSKNWQPLFPRVPEIKISASKRIRKDLAHQIGLLRNSDISSYFNSGEKELGWKSINFITKTDFITFSIMSLLRQKRTLPVICQILGLTYNDYTEYVLKKNDIFSSLTSLTDHGNNLYFEIKKQLKLVKKDIQRKPYPIEIKQTQYLPKNFKGES